MSWDMTPSLRIGRAYYARKVGSPLRAWLRAERAAANLSQWGAAISGWRPPMAPEELRTACAMAMENLGRRTAERDLREVLVDRSRAFHERFGIRMEDLAPPKLTEVVERIPDMWPAGAVGRSEGRHQLDASVDLGLTGARTFSVPVRVRSVRTEWARPALFEDGPDETVHATGWTPRGA